MSVDEDTELRDLIAQNLKKNGVISRIKAELRASVFLALEEEGCLKDRIPIVYKSLMEFNATPEGNKVTSLVHEFLQFFNMNFTLAVFDPESSNSNVLSREELCAEFNLKNVNPDLPILMHLLNKDRGNVEQTKGTEILEGQNTAALENQLISQDLNISKERSMTNISSDSFFDNSRETLQESSQILIKSHWGNTVATNQVKGTSDNLNSLSLNKDYQNESLASDKEGNDFFSSNSNREDLKSFVSKGNNTKENSLASLRDLPALSINSGNREESKDDESIVSTSLTPNSEGGDSIYSVKSDQNISLKKFSFEIDETSEQSIEEEIEEISAGFDDLSSISISDDSTKDGSVSQVSHLTNIDHVEYVSRK